jgi:molybdenum cofactor biosynthesis enzyme MoaA
MSVVRAELLIRRAAQKLLRICVTGGEPLLFPAAQAILRLPQEYPDAGFVLCTNGTPRRDLDQDIIDAGWVVVISLHGRERAHNHYTRARLHHRVEERVRALAPHTVVQIASVLHDGMSPADIDYLAQLREESGATLLRLITPRPHGRFAALRRWDVIEAAQERLGPHVTMKTAASETPFIGVAGAGVTH